MTIGLKLVLVFLCGILVGHAEETAMISSPGGIKKRTVYYAGSSDVKEEYTYYVSSKGEEVRHGETWRFHAYMSTSMVTDYRHGKRHGRRILRNDRFKTIYSFKDDEEHGPRVSFSTSGVPSSVEFFTNGVHLAPFTGEFEYQGKAIVLDMGRAIGGDLMTAEAREELRGMNMGDWARQYIDSGDITNATRYATNLLAYIEMPEVRSDAWTYSVGIHDAHNVLGRVALRRGDIDAAKRHLISAGKTPGDAGTLKSFGPNMALAKELLERGEREIVLKYFVLCRTFWDRDSLNEWRDEVMAGKIPDFGSNLSY